MPELVLHDRSIPTVFDLLGHDENHMTASLGWALAHNAALLNRFVERVAPGVSLTEPPAICWRHDCMGTNPLNMAALNGDVDSGCRAAR